MSGHIPLPATPIDLPLLPLRDVVVFPHMVIPLFVGRPKSIKALEVAMEAGKSILLVAAAVFAAALLWQGAMSWGRGPESLQAAPDEAQRIVDDLDAKIRERDTGSGRK